MTTQTNPRQLIAAETAALMAERGLEGATLRRVAQRLDCTTGYISHYYSSKDDLLEAALHEAVTALERSAQASFVPRTVDQWVDQVVTTLPTDDESRRFWRVLVAFQAGSLASERLTQVLRTYSEGAKSFLYRVLRDAAPEPAPDAAVQELTDALWSLVDGFGTTAVLNPDTFQPEFIRTALLGAVRGLLDKLKEQYP